MDLNHSALGVLRKRSDEELLTSVRAAAARERGATEELLRHLFEVERRKLYLRRGFSSLFDFCVQELGYCAGSAHMRIQSMRLLRDLPEPKREEVASKIASGRLTISQLSNLQTYSRQVGPRGVEPERKLEILARVEGESTRQSQKIILQELGVDVAALERMRIRGPDQVELTVTLSGEAVELLEEWKALTSHANPEGRNGGAILAALRVAVEQGRKKRGGAAAGTGATGFGVNVGTGPHGVGALGDGPTRAGEPGPDEAARTEPRGASAASGGETKPGAEQTQDPRQIEIGGARAIATGSALHAHEVGRRGGPFLREVRTVSISGAACTRRSADRASGISSAIPSAIRRLVWHRDGGQCTFRDHRSGRRCQGRRYLEMDHIRPRADGGPHELANLRLLCGAHHRMRHEGS